MNPSPETNTPKKTNNSETMNSFTTPATPTNVIASAPKLSKADAERLKSALAECARLDLKMAEVSELRQAIRDAARAFADGELTLGQAAGLASISPVAVPDARGAMRAGCKHRQRETIASVADLVAGHREHVAQDLLDRCKKMESRERENAAEIGIHADDFRASGLLESLREQASRSRKICGGIVTRQDLRILAEAIGIEIPVSAPVADDGDEEPLAEGGE
jgi:hypothetical protein